MKIGLSLPLTTGEHVDIRSVAEDVHNAAVLANEVFGSPHELVCEDNGYTPSQASAVVKRFKEGGVSAVLGLPTSNEALDSAAALAAVKLPAITSMATSPKLADTEIFKTRPSDLHACLAMVEHLVEASYGTIATITENHAYPGDCTRSLVEIGTKRGISFVSREFEMLSEDVRPLLIELSEAEPGALFINTQCENGFLNVLRQAREIMPNVQILGSAMPGARIVRENSGADGEGIIYVSEPSLEDVLTDDGLIFLRQFRERFGDEPKTGDYAVGLTLAAYTALHEADAANGNLLDNLLTMDFKSSRLSPFRFGTTREIESAVDQSGVSGDPFVNYQVMILKEGLGRPLVPHSESPA